MKRKQYNFHFWMLGRSNHYQVVITKPNYQLAIRKMRRLFPYSKYKYQFKEEDLGVSPHNV